MRPGKLAVHLRDGYRHQLECDDGMFATATCAVEEMGRDVVVCRILVTVAAIGHSCLELSQLPGAGRLRPRVVTAGAPGIGCVATNA